MNKGIASIYIILLLLSTGILVSLVIYRSNYKTEEPATKMEGSNQKVTNVETPDNQVNKVADTTLKTEELSTGEIKVTDITNGVEFLVPVTFNLNGNDSNYSVAFHGIDSAKGPGPRDFAQLQFRQIKYDGNLYEQVKKEYKLSEENKGRYVDYNNIHEIQFGEITGYYYDCPFLVYQACIYIPLKYNAENYLFILKNFEDSNNRGYETELDEILSTVKYTK